MKKILSVILAVVLAALPLLDHQALGQSEIRILSIESTDIKSYSQIYKTKIDTRGNKLFCFPNSTNLVMIGLDDNQIAAQIVDTSPYQCTDAYIDKDPKYVVLSGFIRSSGVSQYLPLPFKFYPLTNDTTAEAMKRFLSQKNTSSPTPITRTGQRLIPGGFVARVSTVGDNSWFEQPDYLKTNFTRPIVAIQAASTKNGVLSIDSQSRCYSLLFENQSHYEELGPVVNKPNFKVYPKLALSNSGVFYTDDSLPNRVSGYYGKLSTGLKELVVPNDSEGRFSIMVDGSYYLFTQTIQGTSEENLYRIFRYDSSRFPSEQICISLSRKLKCVSMALDVNKDALAVAFSDRTIGLLDQTGKSPMLMVDMRSNFDDIHSLYLHKGSILLVGSVRSHEKGSSSEKITLEHARIVKIDYDIVH